MDIEIVYSISHIILLLGMLIMWHIVGDLNQRLAAMEGKISNLQRKMYGAPKKAEE